MNTPNSCHEAPRCANTQTASDCYCSTVGRASVPSVCVYSRIMSMVVVAVASQLHHRDVMHIHQRLSVSLFAAANATKLSSR